MFLRETGQNQCINKHAPSVVRGAQGIPERSRTNKSVRNRALYSLHQAELNVCTTVVQKTHGISLVAK